MELKFRPLRADEVDCRVAQVKENGLSLLLYKDARCDMNILDETVGPMNWQRKHCRENANCIVSIWDEDKKEWIGKEDTGTESNTEAEKGLASDSFKRACVNWGLGRELYTAPFIWISSDKCTIKPKGQGFTSFDRFRVTELVVENGTITALAVVNDSRKGAEVFRYGRRTAQDPHRAPEPAKVAQEPDRQAKARESVKIGPEQATVLEAALLSGGMKVEALLRAYGAAKMEDLTAEQYCDAMDKISKWKNRRRSA